LIKDKSKWCKLINCYIVKTSLTKVENEMQDLINRFNDDENYRQVLINYREKQKSECKNNDTLFSWRIYNFIHDQIIRAEINTGVKRIEKQKRDAEDFKKILHARVLLKAVNYGKAKYKNEKRQIQELKEQIICEYKENLKKLEAIEKKCHDQNKISIEFYESMETEKNQAKRRAEVTWSELDEIVRKSKYFDDYEMYKNQYVEENMTKWILTKVDDSYVQYCTKVHLSGIKPSDSKALEEEIQQMINDPNLFISIRKALKTLLTELTTTNGDLRPLVTKYRMGNDISEELNIALSYLSKNSQYVGHDLFKLNDEKELDILLNEGGFELKPLLTQINKKSSSVFFVEDVYNRNIDAISIKNSRKKYQLNNFL